MSPTKDARRPSSAQPVTRRSARQERIARRHPERDLRRASTQPGRGRPSPMMLATGGALVIGLVLVAFALLRTGGTSGLPLSPVKTPAYVTAANIQQSGTSGMTLGNPDAKVTIDVWEDYQCTGCGAWTRSEEADLERDYIATGKAKIVFHDYLIIDEQSGGTESLEAANAARCAGDQGKYWQYHDWLYFNQSVAEKSGQYARDRLIESARQVGVDVAQFTTCVDSGRHKAEVQAQSKSTPVSSTPGIFVNNTQVFNAQGSTYSPSYEDVKAAIDKALSGESASPAPSTSPSASGSAGASPSASPSAGASTTAGPSASASPAS